MEATLQSIFRGSFADYSRHHKLPLKHHKAARAIMQCRTEEQGSHEVRCPDGHEHHIQYHSCRHRSCPKCNAQPKVAWAEKQFERLLGVDHYHVVFTLPHELLTLWRYNQRWFVDHFFRVVNDTLMTLMRDEKFLGATPGMLMSLHTWGRTLTLHPHIHCLITGGGLSQAGGWKKARKAYLLPGRVVSQLYRGKFLAALWHGVKTCQLVMPGGDPLAVETLLKAVGRKKWHVRIQPPYSHGEGVMKYLARYVKGGPIGNHRFVSANRDEVVFHYQDHRDGKQKVLTLQTTHFIARLLEHVAESGQHVIRHYGLYGHQSVAKREQCREMLGEKPQTIKKEREKEKKIVSNVCSVCGQALVRVGGIVKNSFYKIKNHGYVQQANKPDIANMVHIRGPCFT